MANGHRTIEDNPVLVREAVRRDGSRAVALRVFCGRRTGSVPLQTCEACPSCIEIASDLNGAGAIVRCKPERAVAATAPTGVRRHGGEDAPGDATPVGTILRGCTFCIVGDAEVPSLLAGLAERPLSEMPVVDDLGRLIGLVRDIHCLRGLRAALGPDVQSGFGRCGVSRIDAVMSPAKSVREDASVRRALRAMAGADVREIPVVARDGQLVGMLRDIDGLHFIAAERGSKR